MRIQVKRRTNSLIQEIDKRKQVEVELRRNREIAERLIENVPTWVKLLAADGTLQNMNRAGLDIIQADSLEQVKGQCVYPMVVEENREEFKELAKDIFQGKSRTLEFSMVGLRGQTHILYTKAVPLHNDKGEIVSALSVTVDVTERRLAEQEREKLVSALQDALSKVKTLSGFLPICASCKKIRDDKGYWNQIENYISQHSEALFSHGYCPECAQTVIQEIEEFKKINDQA